jgi:hypothetical protein
MTDEFMTNAMYGVDQGMFKIPSLLIKAFFEEFPPGPFTYFIGS